MAYIYIVPQINDYVKFFTNHILINHNISKQIVNSADSLFIVEPTIKIEHIKKVIQFVYLKPKHEKKIVLIAPFDNATVIAQNAFLKTLEEAPDYAEIFLLAHLQHKILDTIRSRCFVNFDYIAKKQTDLSNEQSSDKKSSNKKVLDSELINSLFKDSLTSSFNKLDKIKRKEPDKFKMFTVNLLQELESFVLKSNLSPKIKKQIFLDLKQAYMGINFNHPDINIAKLALIINKQYKIT